MDSFNSVRNINYNTYDNSRFHRCCLGSVENRRILGRMTDMCCY